MPITSFSQENGLRCGYFFYRKNAKEMDWVKYLNMRLDYIDGKSVFYDEYSYERDSLRLLAFDERGMTKDPAEYYKIISLPNPKLDEVTFMDYNNSNYVQCYKRISITMRSEGKLEMPSWTLTDESDTIDSCKCKKAIADYLGRTWIVWYTEEIPIPAGPWRLWGTPGLIVDAKDSEDLFHFKLVWTDSLENHNRMDFLDLCYPRFNTRRNEEFRHFFLSPFEAERMNMRLRTEDGYYEDMAGIRVIRRTPGREKKMKYIPLIPSDYWKNK